jgi:hypothetical protein
MKTFLAIALFALASNCNAASPTDTPHGRAVRAAGIEDQEAQRARECAEYQRAQVKEQGYSDSEHASCGKSNAVKPKLPKRPGAKE